jgi:CYTH domain-containing protein/CHAD domain-containing protein
MPSGASLGDRRRPQGTIARGNYALAMAAEIERKFLLDEPPGQLRDRAGRRIDQGYLAGGEGVEVRLRKDEDRHLLTAKLGHGEVREEIEIGLDAGQFDALWPLTQSRRLRKTRYLVPLGEGLEAEIDVFEGDLAGLVTAEVEFGFERQSRDFQAPPWLGDEVSGDRRYSNQSLALEGAPLLSPGKDGKQGDMPSRAYRLKTGESATEGVRRIALGRTGKALERLDGAEGLELAGAIHGARKDLKKLRGLLRLVRKELGKKTFKAENRRYRDAGRLLSGSRDTEVKLETLLALRHRFSDLPTDAAERWEGMLETERDELATALRDDGEAQLARATTAIAAGRDEVRRWSLRTDSWALVEPGLSRSYREGRRALKRVQADPSAESVHEWRKRAKDLWYELRIVRDAWPALLAETADQAHELTELLGDHHDLAVLADDLGSRDALGDRDAFETAIGKRQKELLDAALAIGRRLYAEQPKAFGRRIKHYWRAWRKT